MTEKPTATLLAAERLL